MNYWRHRFSKDIDIFVSDAQLLNYFSPRMNGTLGDSDYDEQMNFIKVWLPDGEIDFILARNITNLPPNIVEISGNNQSGAAAGLRPCPLTLATPERAAAGAAPKGRDTALARRKARVTPLRGLRPSGDDPAEGRVSGNSLT